MEPIIFLLLSTSLIGIFLILGLSHFKIENNLSSHSNERNHSFDSFISKVKNNSLKIKN